MLDWQFGVDAFAGRIPTYSPWSAMTRAAIKQRRGQERGVAPNDESGRDLPACRVRKGELHFRSEPHRNGCGTSRRLMSVMSRDI
jgi:hypothetical protein